MIWALAIQSQFNRKLRKAARKAGQIQSKGHSLQGTAAMGSRNCYARAAAARGNVARRWRYTPTNGWSQLYLLGGGGLPVPELLEKQAGPL